MKNFIKSILASKMKTFGAVCGLLAVFAVAAYSAPAAVSATRHRLMTVEHPAYDGQLVIPAGKSQFVKVHEPFAEVAIGNPEIADVVMLANQTLYVLGKKIGSTNLSISDSHGNVMAIMDVAVTYDVEALKRKMYQLAPGDVVEVRPAGESIVLSGQVASADRLRQLVQVAEQYAPAGKVTNMLTVGGSQQVLLKVRFAEVSRSVMKELGVGDILNLSNGKNVATIGQTADPLSFLQATGSFHVGHLNLLSTIDALETQGFVHTLAEPNIIALSGDNAKFLAGGEFPVPTAQTASSTVGGIAPAITVDFKTFGVGLSFTPTVTGKDTINLQLDAEVSAIDPTVSVTTGGLTIPGLKTRKTSTTVELLDGQSFAISGLLQDNFTDGLNGIPGLSSLPIIGALVSSKNFQRNQTELVVIIEAHLVQPVVARALASPTDNALPPSELNLFLMGDTEKAAAVTKAVGIDNKAAGIDGPYGYILP